MFILTLWRLPSEALLLMIHTHISVSAKLLTNIDLTKCPALLALEGYVDSRLFL